MACLLLGPKRSGKTSLLLRCACSIAAATGPDSGASALPQALTGAGEAPGGGIDKASKGTSQPASVLFICSRAKMESSPPYLPPGGPSSLLSRIHFHYVESYRDVLQLCAALHLAAAAAHFAASLSVEPGPPAPETRPGSAGPARAAGSSHGQAAKEGPQSGEPSSAPSAGREPLPCAILVDDFLDLFDTCDRWAQRRAHRADAGELEGQVSKTVALLSDTAQFLTDRMSAAAQPGPGEPRNPAEASQDGHAPAFLDDWSEAGGACCVGRRCALFLAAEGSDLASSAVASPADAGSEAYRRCSAVLHRWVPNILRISPTSSPGCFQACGQVGDPNRWQWPPAANRACEKDRDRSWDHWPGAGRCPCLSIPADRSLFFGTPSAPDLFARGVGAFVHASCQYGAKEVIGFSYCVPC